MITPRQQFIGEMRGALDDAFADWLQEKGDQPQITGRAIIELVDVETKEIKQREVQENLIVDQGRTYIQKNIQNDSPVDPAYIVTSDSATAVGASDVTVNATVLLGKSATKSRPANTTCRFAVTYSSSESNGTIRSVAIANAANGTLMFSRLVLSSAVTKDSSSELNVQYDLTITW